MFRVLLASGVAWSIPFVAAAQESAPDNVYGTEYFTRFSPSTALDMVDQVPGFSLEEEDDESRGFGEASGNVLINGKRLSGKSNSPRDALARIPAANVEKIEVLEGATLDIPGLSGRVVNVVAETDGVSGTWQWRQRYRDNLPPALLWVEASATGRSGDLSWTLGLRNNEYRGGAEGLENVFDGNRVITERREESVAFIANEPNLSGSLEWTPSNGHVANLNAEYERFNARETESSIRFPVSTDPERRRLFRFSEDHWEAEVGGDYEFGLGPGRLKLIGLHGTEHNPIAARLFEGAVDGSSAFSNFFMRTTDQSESILRAEYGWSAGEGRDWQVSLEGAFNTLDADAAFGSSDVGAPIDIAALPVAVTQVEERRAEAFVTHTRTLTPKLSVQAALGAEYSELEQSLPGQLTRSFTRPKGFVSATYKASDDLTISAKVERAVGQLDFFTFVSSQNISVGTADVGNPDIVPEQNWNAEIEFERDLGDAGAATLRFYGEEIEDVVDRVPFGPDSEGPGNLDSATRYGAELDATFKFDPIGLNGLQWTIEAEARNSSIEDPLTGETRRTNEDLTLGIFTELRHDIPNTDWAWGIAFERFDHSPIFRLDEKALFEARPGFMFGFVEHKDIFGMTGTIFLANLIDQDDQFTREVFAPRRDGALAFVEDRSRNFGPIWTIRLKGTF